MMSCLSRHLVDPAVSFQLVLSEDGSGGAVCADLLLPIPIFFAKFTFFFVQISLTILGRGAGLAAATVARQNL